MAIRLADLCYWQASIVFLGALMRIQTGWVGPDILSSRRHVTKSFLAMPATTSDPQNSFA